jgi:hypothetical protein
MGNVTVAIYRNEVAGRKAPLYKITRKRWYVSNGELKHVLSLFRDDIPVAGQLERWAWERIYELQREDRKAAKANSKAPAEEPDVIDDAAIAAADAE